MMHPTFSLKNAIPASLGTLTLATIAIVGLCIVAADEPSPLAATWKRHHESCHELPEEAYRKDRARVSRGVVRDSAGNPVSRSLVRCVRLTSLFQAARREPTTPMLWSGLVETQTVTDSEGRYEFPYLSEGSRAFCVSAPGFAPSVQSPILVQDGMGAWVDFTLEAPATLRVRLHDAGDRPLRVYLVPHRWWPELMSRDVTGGEAKVEFTGLGGPFRKGLVLVADLGDAMRWKLAGAFDLDRSHEVAVSCTQDPPAATLALPEAVCLGQWNPEVEKSPAGRLFFGLLSPVALFWPTISTPESAPDGTKGPGPKEPSAESRLRGLAPHAFLPVLIESRGGGAWFEWSSSASEFEHAGMATGVCRVRSLNPDGRISFARGLVIGSGGLTELATPLDGEIQLDEPSSSEVMGIVRWEDGRPVEGAAVFVQDTASFRRFLKRVVTDRNGYFHVANVPEGVRYLTFALPPEERGAMKRFSYFRTDPVIRESWIDLELSPHRVVGRRSDIGPRGRLQLISQSPPGQAHVVWTFSPDEDGQFEISNVPHGRYIVRAARAGASPGLDSIPFEVDLPTRVVVRWPDSPPEGSGSGPSPPVSGR